MDYLVVPRCGLCRFDFTENEVITIRRSSPIKNGHYITHPLSELEDDGNSYPARHPRSRRAGGRRTGYHADCIRQRDCPSVPRLSDATSYAYGPPPGENARRLRWVRSRLASVIYYAVACRLPYELCDMIARYGVREYALYISKKFCQDNTAAEFRIDVRKPVWARYAFLDGLRYIASLANKPLWSDAVSLSRPEPDIRVAYVVEDHLGVRDVRFGGFFYKPPQDHTKPGLWWRTVELLHQKLVGQTDGTKLRRLICPSTDPIAPYHIPSMDVLWATLPRCLERFDLLKLMKTYQPVRMMALRLDENVTGYSFCWNRCTIAIKAHSDGEDLSVYKNTLPYRPDALWIYIPLRQGERITEIWLRLHVEAIQSTLVVITSTGRVHFMGAYPILHQSEFKYRLLYKADPSHGPFYLDESPAGIQAVAYMYISNKVENFPPLAPLPHPDCHPSEEFLYTSACVDNVTHVRLCRAKSSSVITGLVFEYADGHRESVGQTRLDWLGDAILIDPSEKMWLKFSRYTGRFPRVVDAGFSPISKSMGHTKEYFYIMWHGILHWWVSLNQCWLYQDGRESFSENHRRELLLSEW
ncbi:hypothetical protein GGR50DRAFT_702799 [Xylaria sp. CBS 124048]|nr:hypothetical protein GGR50DRAFT_702799 [Xylaria sp. CBS 124048]